MATKRRIIAALLVRRGILVQSIGFQRYLPVGKPEIAARFLDDWGVDEILLLDISASREDRLIPVDLVERVARVCRVPLTVGGGISSVEDVRTLIKAGADKVSINAALIERPELLAAAASQFGVQCIVAAMDVLAGDSGHAGVYSHGGSRDIGQSSVDVARRYAEVGAGEILLNTIHCDGQRNGYDCKLADDVAGAVGVPLIAMGGAGCPDHVRTLLETTRVSAAAIGNMLHYCEHSVTVIKSALRSEGLDLRLDSQADYRHMRILPDGRLDRRPESELEAEIFEHIPREVI
jgi:imidazole glycerol-phosphate synthase subunit HisF